MDRSELIFRAKRDKWSRKAVKKHIYGTPLWDLRDSIFEELGMPITGQAAELAAARQRQEIELAEAEAAAQVAESARIQALRDQSEREQKEAKEAELAAYRAEERIELEGIEPHWPTYRRVLALINDCREFEDAVRHRDSGDIMAFKYAPKDLMHLAEIVLLDDRSVVADILKKTNGAMTEKQAKLVALIIAKLASRNGMTGNEPLSPTTHHRQESLEAEVEQFAVTLNRSDDRRIAVQIIATKKTGKPYLAKLDSGFNREFAKRKKFTNSRNMFTLKNLQIGDVVEFRGFNWTGREYEGGVEYAVIGNGLIYFISRFAAKGITSGDDLFYCDEMTEIFNYLPNKTKIPAELKERSAGDFTAWCHDSKGNLITD